VTLNSEPSSPIEDTPKIKKNKKKKVIDDSKKDTPKQNSFISILPLPTSNTNKIQDITRKKRKYTKITERSLSPISTTKPKKGRPSKHNITHSVITSPATSDIDSPRITEKATHVNSPIKETKKDDISHGMISCPNCKPDLRCPECKLICKCGWGPADNRDILRNHIKYANKKES